MMNISTQQFLKREGDHCTYTRQSPLRPLPVLHVESIIVESRDSGSIHHGLQGVAIYQGTGNQILKSSLFQRLHQNKDDLISPEEEPGHSLNNSCTSHVKQPRKYLTKPAVLIQREVLRYDETLMTIVEKLGHCCWIKQKEKKKRIKEQGKQSANWSPNYFFSISTPSFNKILLELSLYFMLNLCLNCVCPLQIHS